MESFGGVFTQSDRWRKARDELRDSQHANRHQIAMGIGASRLHPSYGNRENKNSLNGSVQIPIIERDGS